MRHVAVLRGVTAMVKWFPQARIVAGEHFTAAQVERYTVTRKQDNTWSVVARVVLADAYKMDQRPLFFVAPHKTGAFRWPMLSHEVGGDGLLRARLGELDENGGPDG